MLKIHLSGNAAQHRNKLRRCLLQETGPVEIYIAPGLIVRRRLNLFKNCYTKFEIIDNRPGVGIFLAFKD